MKSPGLLLLALTLHSGLSFATDVGQPVPDCHSESSSILIVNPSQFSGKVVLIDFWATWCPPCIQSIPFFNKLTAELQSQKFEILAVNVDEDKATIDDFLKQHPIDYPTVFNPTGECPQAFEVKAMPSSFLIDKKGIVRKIFLGFRDSDQSAIKAEITHLLSE
jgi:thiol-disulfide isomerase/thioredoxin